MILVQIYDMGLRRTDFNMPGADNCVCFLENALDTPISAVLSARQGEETS